MKQIIYYILFASLISLITCKKPQEDPNPTAPPSTDTSQVITADQRLAVLDAISAKIASSNWQNVAEANDQLLKFLESMPELEQAGWENNENLSARFTDGRVIIIYNNRTPPADPSGGRLAAPEVLQKVYSGAKIGQLPGSRIAHVFFGFDENYTDPTPVLRSLLEKKIYQVVANKASIDKLKEVTTSNESGIFYLDTHGGWGRTRPLSGSTDSTSFYAFWTTDSTTLANESKYNDDLNKQHLCYAVEVQDLPNGKVQANKHYAFTKNFVKEYMKFGNDCLFYLDACSSFSNEDMKNTFISKTANQKGTYLGWTKPVSDRFAYVSTKVFFDRLLGTNATLGNVPLENPLQRPFDVEAVLKYMEQQNFLKENLSEERKTPSGNVYTYNWVAQLSAMATSLPEQPILAPSIAYLQMNEQENKLYIYGIFGSNPGADGKVTVDGQVLSIDSWEKNQIVCPIQPTGKGSAGDVLVKVREHESNTVQLTDWHWKIELTRAYAGSLKQTLVVDLHLRADVHAYRKAPHEAPQPYVYHLPLPGLDSGLAMVAVNDSKGFYSVGGLGTSSWNDGCANNDKEEWAGYSVTLPLLSAPVSTPTDQIAPSCWLNPKTRTMEVSFAWMAVNGINWNYTYSYSCPDGSSGSDQSNGVIPNSGTFFTPYFSELAGITEDDEATFRIPKVEFDENFNIKAYQKSFTTDSNSGNLVNLNNKTCVVTFKWNAVTAKFPPRKDSGARLSW